MGVCGGRECFDNCVDVLVICVLCVYCDVYFLYCVFVLFRICIFIHSYLFCLYWWKDYCHRVKTQIQ